jgi:hypothetical protein
LVIAVLHEVALVPDVLHPPSPWRFTTARVNRRRATFIAEAPRVGKSGKRPPRFWSS